MAPHELKSNFVYISTLKVILWTMSWLTAIWQAWTSINKFINSLEEGTTTILKNQIQGTRHTNSLTTQTIGPAKILPITNNINEHGTNIIMYQLQNRQVGKYFQTWYTVIT